jgi:hypothetical protein
MKKNHHATLTKRQFEDFAPYKDKIQNSQVYRFHSSGAQLSVRASVAANGLHYISTNMAPASLIIILIKLGLHL